MKLLLNIWKTWYIFLESENSDPPTIDFVSIIMRRATYIFFISDDVHAEGSVYPRIGHVSVFFTWKQ